MGLLTNKLPTTVKVGGVDFPINTDFRTSINYELVAWSKKSEIEIALEALQLYFGDNIPQDVDGALKAIVWFYSCGKEEKPGRAATERPFYFDHDDEYIYSAFKDQYSIDLEEIEYMHWWKFRAMFRALKDDNQIAKIMSYRTMDINKLPKEQRGEYRKLKELYKPPLSKEEREESRAIVDALKKGVIPN